MPENTDAEIQQENGGEEQEQKTFSQAEVDKIVRSRAERLAKQLYPDYDDLKAAADGAKTVEQKLADLEKKSADAETRALRSSIAAEFGISTKKGDKGEPSDADLFLTGSDEATLTAQARRLAEQMAGRKKGGNVAPKEGSAVTTTISPKDAAKREWLRSVTGADA